MLKAFKEMYSKKDYNTLTKEELLEAYLVDVRTQAEFDEGNVVGSICIPLNEIEQNLAQFEDKDTIVLFCKSGNRSGQAKNILERHGIKNVHNAGGWEQVLKALENDE